MLGFGAVAVGANGACEAMARARPERRGRAGAKAAAGERRSSARPRCGRDGGERRSSARPRFGGRGCGRGGYEVSSSSPKAFSPVLSLLRTKWTAL